MDVDNSLWENGDECTRQDVAERGENPEVGREGFEAINKITHFVIIRWIIGYLLIMRVGEIFDCAR